MFLLVLACFAGIGLRRGFVPRRKPFQVILKQGSQTPQGRRKLLDGSEAHGKETGLEGDIRRQFRQPRIDVSWNQVAQLSTYGRRLSLGADNSQLDRSEERRVGKEC